MAGAAGFISVFDVEEDGGSGEGAEGWIDFSVLFEPLVL